MKYINVRQLLNNLSEIEKNLPVTVTRYGKPIFKIDKVDEKGSFEERGKQLAENFQKISEEKKEEEYIKCSHPLCKEPADAFGKEEENLGFGDFVDVPMCKKHAQDSLRKFAAGIGGS